MHKKLLLALLIGSPLLAMEERLVPRRVTMDERGGRAVEALTLYGDCCRACCREGLEECCACCVPPCIFLVGGVSAMVTGLADAGVRVSADKVALALNAAGKFIRKLNPKTD